MLSVAETILDGKQKQFYKITDLYRSNRKTYHFVFIITKKLVVLLKKLKKLHHVNNIVEKKKLRKKKRDVFVRV